ncbi:MAG: ClcB-like voltage-gated chloride channel protein [Burkholderiales bacterium]|nr:ClcB-like voltage-gated chloride channel protein [Burkholderiales bacterium]
MRRLLAYRILVLQRLRTSEWQRTLLWASAIGALGALATIGFREGLLLTERLLYGRSDGLVHIARGLVWWLRLITPAIGGVVAGGVLMWARRAAAGSPGGDYMESVAIGDGVLGVRSSCLRALSSAATVASGGAIGREGPMVQLAALTGSLVGRWRDAPVPRRKLMVACGAAAGLATAYNAPMAGALFVAEILLGTLAVETLGPLLIATVAANVTSGLIVGNAPVYHMPPFVLPNSGWPTLLLALLGILAGLGAPLYLWILDRAHIAYRRWKAPLWLKLGSGGLIVGVVSVFNPGVWGNGYSVVNSILQGGWLAPALLAVLVAKLVGVAATTGSGAVGGIFTPTLFMGAVVGALYGMAMHTLLPGTVPASASIAIGMGAFLAACTHAPLTSVLMIFEMTENYGVVVPLMLACMLGYYVSRVLRPKSIYAASANVSAPVPALRMAQDLLRPESATITPGASLTELEAVFLQYRWKHVYLVEPDGRFIGAIALHDLAPLVTALTREDQRWPDTIVQRDYPRVQLTTPVWQVLETFATHAGERLPVLDPEGRLRGHVTKTDLVLMFRERLAVG